MSYGYGYDYYSESDSDDYETAEEYESNVDVCQFYGQIADHLKTVQRNKRKKLKLKSKIQQVKKHMERVFTRTSVLFCIDVEAWEHNQRYVTEIGVSIYDPRYQELALIPNIKTYHIVIAENRDVYNGEHVPDHRENFSGGTTYILSLNQTRSLLQDLVDHYFGPVFPLHCSLVGHDLRGDLKWFENIGVDIPNNVRKLDTQTLFSYTHGLDGASLKNALRTVNQPFSFLHNAGNDAYYTILLALKLCDPNVRELTRIDYLKPGERYGDSVSYKKTETNKSKYSTASVQGLFDEITDT